MMGVWRVEGHRLEEEGGREREHANPEGMVLAEGDFVNKMDTLTNGSPGSLFSPTYTTL